MNVVVQTIQKNKKKEKKKKRKKKKNVVVQEAVQEKGRCYKVWDGTRNTGIYVNYVKAKKHVKIVRNEKSKPYGNLYDKLEQEKTRDIFKLAKMRERKLGTQIM